MAKRPFTPIPPMAELPSAEEINAREILDKYLSGEIDLICVLGPTASGKTRYAVELARRINALLSATDGVQAGSESVLSPWPQGEGAPDRERQGFFPTPPERRTTGAEIISADSRQVYRGMDIGTGKDLADYTFVNGDGVPVKVPYHLIDIAEAGEKYEIFRQIYSSYMLVVYALQATLLTLVSTV